MEVSRKRRRERKKNKGDKNLLKWWDGEIEKMGKLESCMKNMFCLVIKGVKVRVLKTRERERKKELKKRKRRLEESLVSLEISPWYLVNER